MIKKTVLYRQQQESQIINILKINILQILLSK